MVTMAKAVKKAGKKAAAPKKAAAKKAVKSAPKKAAPKAAAKKAAPKKAATPKKAAAKKSSSATSTGLKAPLTPDPALSAVIGSKPVPRTEIVKKIWDYIKQNKLQDQTNKRMINADDKLRAVFGGKSQVSMFELSREINKHVK